jgi:hypothetical protein
MILQREGEMARHSERDEHRKDLAELLETRTEQLRQTIAEKQELLQCLTEICSLGSLREIKEVAQAALNRFGTAIEAPKFGGEPGESVPQVDPEDVKSVWRIQNEVQAKYPGQQVATGTAIAQSACKPGADIHAVCYRASLLFLVQRVAADKWQVIVRNGEPHESVFNAAAKVPMEWVGVGQVRKGLPFDLDAFLRLCEPG